MRLEKVDEMSRKEFVRLVAMTRENPIAFEAVSVAELETLIDKVVGESKGKFYMVPSNEEEQESMVIGVYNEKRVVCYRIKDYHSKNPNNTYLTQGNQEFGWDEID